MIVLDLETVPQPRNVIEAKMPEEIRNPVCPDEIAFPPKPDFEEKCPKYASAKDRDEKRAEWIGNATAKWIAKTQTDYGKWKEKADAARESFFNRAALDARLGHAKLIGMRDTDAEIDRVFVWEESAEQATKITTWYRALPEMHHGRSYQGRSMLLTIFPTEAGMLSAFFRKFEEAMWPAVSSRDPAKWEKCITYFGHYFDFPFLYRRSWILGAPQQPFFMRGRFFEPYMIDLHDAWQFGDRSEVSGGLEGLSTTLGLPGKNGKDGASFHEWYAEDPTEGVVYLLNDLSATEGSAERMGIIRPKRTGDPI